MKDALVSQKADASATQSTQAAPSAGPQGIALDPPAYGIDALDQAGNADLSASDQEDAELQDALHTEYRGAPFRLGSETHHVVIKTIGDKIVVGVESDFTTMDNIKQTLLGLAAQPGHALAGREARIRALFEDAEDASADYDKKWWKFAATARKLRKLRRPRLRGPKLGKAARAAKEQYEKLREQWRNDLKAKSYAQQTLEREVKQAIEAAWAEYGDFLGPNLMPVGVVFRDRPFTGNTSRHTYHTGAQTDPIPIVWYKAPTDYPAVVVGGVAHSLTATPAGSVPIGSKSLGVSPANKPSIGGAFQLRKVAHHDNRAGQQAFNTEFNTSGAGVRLSNGTVKMNALGAGGFDGDHVKDLGFNGRDTDDNYWPLEAAINRRAFNGYNSGYIVNYLDTHVAPHTHKARSIGGMIGKYFRVKDYMPYDPTQNIPRETDTEYAGTDDIHP